MKNRKIIGGFLLLAAILAGWWWLTSKEGALTAPAANAPETSPAFASTRIPSVAAPTVTAKNLPASSVEEKAAVALPVIAPAKPAQVETIAEVPAIDPTAELAATQDGIAQLLRKGEYIAFVREYTPPQELAAMPQAELDGRQSMDHNPQVQPMLNFVAGALENLKNQTPALNAAGDQAVYMVEQPNSPDPQNLGPQPITFVKVDGKWYKEPTVMTMVDGKWYLAHQSPPK